MVFPSQNYPSKEYTLIFVIKGLFGLMRSQTGKPKIQNLDCYHRTTLRQLTIFVCPWDLTLPQADLATTSWSAGNFRRILDQAARPVMTDPMPNELSLAPWGAASDRLLREVEAADFLRLSPGTLRQWRYKGQGPTYQKLGSRVVYRLSDIVRLVENSSNVAR